MLRRERNFCHHAVKCRLKYCITTNYGVAAGLRSKVLETYPSVSAEWLMRGVGSMFAADGHVGGENIANNNNSQINAGDTINRLVSLLEEKDKHINQLLQILASK